MPRLISTVSVPVLLFALSLALVTPATGEEIDASKPTNFYTQLNNNLEYNSRDSGGNLIGYRGELLFPLNDRNLFLFEVPLLYNDGSEAFGVGDIRGRYFWLPYKNYEKFVGAFGPSVDIFAPTGNFEDGLGSSSWLVQPGVMTAFMFADWIQAFVVASYAYTSKPTTDLIPDSLKMDQHGLSLQSITPVVFSEKFFMQVTPIWSLGDVEDSNTSRYIQEVLAQYAV